MYFDRISGRGGTQASQQVVIPVRPKDQVAFSCRLCGDCCRRVWRVPPGYFYIWRINANESVR